MALMEDDFFTRNVLDEPDELERFEEGDEDPEIHNEDQENKGDEGENKENSEDKKDEKKKRKKSEKPKLNILRLMDNKNGLAALENMYKDVNFKGKGHEREDLNLIMRKLEIWAHQLYPSLQFDDCLGKLEKLGNNRSVITHMKRIRMGLDSNTLRVDDNVDTRFDDDDDEELQTSPNNDAFDQLLNTENRQPVISDNVMSQPTNAPLELTAEQRERMLRNRLIAEQRRMARMKARQQQQENTVHDNQETMQSTPLETMECDGIPDDVTDSSMLERPLAVEEECNADSFDLSSETIFQHKESDIPSESEILVCNTSECDVTITEPEQKILQAGDGKSDSVEIFPL